MRASIFQLISCICVLFSLEAYAHESDFKTQYAYGAQSSVDLIKQEKWSEALKQAKKSANPILFKVITWLYVKDAKSKASFDEITAFIHQNPRWPDIATLRRKAEEAISPGMPYSKLQAWFSKYPPLSARGALLYAEAKTAELAKKPAEKQTTQEKDEITKLHRLYWIRADFNREKEKAFLKVHKKLIRQDDVVARIERLMGEKKHHAAERILDMLPADKKAVYVARIALQQKLKTVDDLVAKVPQKFKHDKGLLYDIAHYRQKHDQEDQLQNLLQHAPKSLPHSEKWWLIKHRQIRWLFKQKRYKEAYQLAKHHGLQSGKDYADAEWISGWIALRFLGDPRTAYKHFYTLYQKVRFPISLARAAYWAGRAAEANQNIKISQDWYKLGARHPDTFYGQLSTLKVDQDRPLKIPSRPTTTKEDVKSVHANSLVQAAYLLMKMRYFQEAKILIRQAIAQSHKPGQIAYMVDLVGQNNHAFGMSVALAKQAAQRNVIVKDKNYPISPQAVSNTVLDKHLTHAIIRQESNFDSSARSSAGALGLMQLMPETAKNVAKEIRLKFIQSKLAVPGYNIQLGANHMQQLLKEYNGSYILSLAAYNGGGHHVNRWMLEYGDPRDKNKLEDIIDWMELIPFGETRNYVQRVIENVQIYRSLLKKDVYHVREIVEDLTRGK